eukprot:TRINITY_DN2377_c6_g1_i1.p1 TRINITY_DN2377_c6_g1~~TRINITY_DN2377_c6_g1_i1.p1  ORF type:complete len:448 (+),score=78.12 TRINITY_DN2377_c6_g1_i1:42-1385(+)
MVGLSFLKKAFKGEDGKCKELPKHIKKMLPGDDDWTEAAPAGLFSDEETSYDDEEVWKGAQKKGSTLQVVPPSPVRIGKAGVGEAGDPMSPYPLVIPKKELPDEVNEEEKQIMKIDMYLNSDGPLELGNTMKTGLRSVCWGGIPSKHRGLCWQLLSCYLSLQKERRCEDLVTKRTQYHDCVETYYEAAVQSPSRETSKILYLLKKDIPRTNPKIPMLSLQPIQDIMERVLFMWSLRHPAAGYVQGMNDLLTPFLLAFMSSAIEMTDLLGQANEVERRIETVLEADEYFLKSLEADVFWCFTAMLHNIQDHFTEAQPGIQSKLRLLDALLEKADPKLHTHLKEENVALVEFAFKWINCLFLREISTVPLLRLWDTYICEGDDYPVLHVYVCLALLSRFSPQLTKLPFCELIPFLLTPPTAHFNDTDIAELISNAYLFQQLYPPPDEYN